MADYYSRISARFWIDTKGWGERNQLVALYLLTNTHSSMEGLYHLPIGYLCADLGLSAKQALDALTFISQAGVVSYDPAAEVVFVCKALKHGAPRTPNHITGAMNRLRSVPSSPLWHEFAMACERHADGLAKAIQKEWPTAFALSVLSTQDQLPPLPPASGGSIDNSLALVDDPAPTRPSSNRRREVDAFDRDMTAWANRHFPEAVSPAAVQAVVGETRRHVNGGPVTPADVEAFAHLRPNWLSQLGLPDPRFSEGEAAA